MQLQVYYTVNKMEEAMVQLRSATTIPLGIRLRPTHEKDGQVPKVVSSRNNNHTADNPGSNCNCPASSVLSQAAQRCK